MIKTSSFNTICAPVVCSTAGPARFHSSQFRLSPKCGDANDAYVHNSIRLNLSTGQTGRTNNPNFLNSSTSYLSPPPPARSSSSSLAPLMPGTMALRRRSSATAKRIMMPPRECPAKESRLGGFGLRLSASVNTSAARRSPHACTPESVARPSLTAEICTRTRGWDCCCSCCCLRVVLPVLVLCFLCSGGDDDADGGLTVFSITACMYFISRTLPITP
mmetsp:Transcript_15133/g.32441  ORF Transcript_15133/g.32441 Transcript_15133/m.32441 type:complete len:218 (+) Transcript_15133:138-791(+)